MTIHDVRFVSRTYTNDDKPLYVVRNNLHAGENTRMHGTEIGDNQAVGLTNVSLDLVGKISKRPGSNLIGNDVSNNSFVVLHNYEIQGASDQLLGVEGTNLRKWTGSGDWSAAIKSDLASSTDVGIISGKESGVSPDDVVLVCDDTNNVHCIESDGTEKDLADTNTSPPITTVMCWYGNRFWGLSNDLLYWSDAYPVFDVGAASYGGYDRTTNWFRIPVGEERGLAPTRDTGIIVLGDKAIWGIAPSVTPAATDKPEPLITDVGCVSKKGWCMVGDDIWFYAQDGLRSLKRTVQDKLQVGVTFPLDHLVKDLFDEIDWNYIDRLSMEYFENKVFISVPTSSSEFKVWVAYPSLQTQIPGMGTFPAIAPIDGWSPMCFAKYKVSGDERLYYGKYGDGTSYRAWNGYTDEGTTTTDGTAITMTVQTRKEDLGQPLVDKVGGELEVRALKSGSYTISVYASFDEGGYNLLGTVDLSTTTVTFPATFPVSFAEGDVVRTKFHLDSYGAWRTIQLKFVHNTTNSTDEISMLGYSVVAYPEEYETE